VHQKINSLHARLSRLLNSHAPSHTRPILPSADVEEEKGLRGFGISAARHGVELANAMKEVTNLL